MIRELNDEKLAALFELDELRERARKLKNEGMKSLGAYPDRCDLNQGVPLDGDAGHAEETIWQGSGKKIEAALLVRVQNKRESGSAHESLLVKIRELELVEDFLTDKKIPVLLAARAMQSLIATAEHTLSKPTLLCYYRIIREIYVADSPDWNAGGARAGAGGEVTAYVTAECIRAVLMLARSIKKTAEFFRRTGEFYRHIDHLGAEGIPEEWRRVESERAALDWYISVAHGAAHLAVKVTLADTDPATKSFTFERIKNYFPKLSEELRNGFAKALVDFNAALDAINYARLEIEEKMTSPEAKSRYIRSESAHKLAEQVIKDALKNAEDAMRLCSENPGELGNMGALADLFEHIAHDVRKLLEPAKRYVGSVLDHELTAASQERPLWDARELAFAAGAYGALTEWRKDERLVRACVLLVNALSEEGMFPRGRPFHSMPDGRRWTVIQFEVCRTFSELLQHVDVPVTPALVKQMLFPFEHNMMPDVNGKVRGWHMENPPIPRRPTLWVSAHAVLALDKVVRMLNRKINAMVLENFSVKKPEQISFGLDQLYYPDHGRRMYHAPGDGKRQGEEGEESLEPIGITLQRMRAHIVDANLPEGGAYTRLFSSVLHGPPGTGKTTLLEALAKSSNAPLVEMSPSDIAVSGQEAIEARARATFKALSMLTKVVIIFDEFEPILLKRDDSPKTQGRDIYTFLTPGMLPKLVTLYGAAKAKGVAYALVTNRLEDLDPAAIRPGRFDHRVGIYMPDPVSRAGKEMLRLLSVIRKRMLASPVASRTGEEKPDATRANKQRKKVGLSADEMKRFRNIIRETGGISPARLAVSSGMQDTVLDRKPRSPNLADLPEPGCKEYQKRNTAEQTLIRWELALRRPASNYDALLANPATLI